MFIKTGKESWKENSKPQKLFSFVRIAEYVEVNPFTLAFLQVLLQDGENHKGYPKFVS